MSEVKHYKDFMCVCSEESMAHVTEVMKRVYADLNLNPGPYSSWEDETKRGGLLTAVVYGLQHGLGDEDADTRYIGSIDAFLCDQWCAVSAGVKRCGPGDDGYVDHASIYVQCDLVEHGVARVWELANEAVGG